MNHVPIYGTRPPSWCSVKGDTADLDKPVDCEVCRRKIAEQAELYNTLAQLSRDTFKEHQNRARAMHYESLLETAGSTLLTP